MTAARAFAFGSFTLMPAQQALVRGTRAVWIGGRALRTDSLVMEPGAGHGWANLSNGPGRILRVLHDAATALWQRRGHENTLTSDTSGR